MSPVPSDLPSKKAVDRAGRRLTKARLGPLPSGGSRRMQFDPGGFRGQRDFRETLAIVRVWRRAHAYPLRKTSASLRHYVRDVPDAQVSQRLKKFGTIIHKLERFEQMKLSRMEDVGGCRVVVPTMDEVRDLARRLKKNWTVTRDRDYVTEPKQDGYRARHLVATKDGCSIEVQIRTPLQDLWANAVERDGRRSGVGLKFGEGDVVRRGQYKLVSDLMAAEERGETLAAADIEDLRAIFDPPGDG